MKTTILEILKNQLVGKKLKTGDFGDTAYDMEDLCGATIIDICSTQETFACVNVSIVMVDGQKINGIPISLEENFELE